MHPLQDLFRQPLLTLRNVRKRCGKFHLLLAHNDPELVLLTTTIGLTILGVEKLRLRLVILSTVFCTTTTQFLMSTY